MIYHASKQIIAASQKITNSNQCFSQHQPNTQQETNLITTTTKLSQQDANQQRNQKQMPKTKLSPITLLLTATAIFLVLLVPSARLFSASAVSIAMANYYPDDGETYDFVDHFIEQTTAVNTNTTVSVSIDGEQPIPMLYQGIKNEIVPGDTVARDWYTWNITIPPITIPGTHTYQFFRHYYVWQEADQYWAEFNSQSTLQTFTIAGDHTSPSPPPSSETTNPLYIFTAIAASAITALVVLVAFTLRKHTRNHADNAEN